MQFCHWSPTDFGTRNKILRVNFSWLNLYLPCNLLHWHLNKSWLTSPFFFHPTFHVMANPTTLPSKYVFGSDQFSTSSMFLSWPELPSSSCWMISVGSYLYHWVCPCPIAPTSRPLKKVKSHYCWRSSSKIFHFAQYSCLENPMDGGAWQAAVHGVAKSRIWLSDFPFTFHFHALEKEMATQSSVLAWRISGMGEPGGLPSMGSHRVRHDWSDLAAAAAAQNGYNVASKS